MAYVPTTTAEDLADAEARLADPRTPNRERPYLRDRVKTLRAVLGVPRVVFASPAPGAGDKLPPGSNEAA